jgi:hypothetical protein
MELGRLPNHLAFKPLPCAQCGHSLLSPTWSEILSDTQTRHLWSCHACGYKFEATVFFPQSQEMPKAA